MKTVDVAIIGAGAAGLTLAADLADQVRVVVLEREEQAGYHASGRSAAVFVPSYGKGLIRNLTSKSGTFYDAPDPEFFPGTLLKERGLLRLVLSGGCDEHAGMISGQPGIERISIDEAARLFPMVRQEDFIAASYERDVHDIDTHALLHGAMRRARQNRAEFRFGAQVSGLRRDGSGWIVTTPSETFVASVIVNAAGAWANDVATMAGVSTLALQPCRRSFAVLPIPVDLSARGDVPFTVTAPMRWYAKTEANQLFVSPGDEDPVTPHDVQADDLVIAEGLHRFSEDTGHVIRRVETTLAGIRTITPDEYPAVGFDPELEGFFWLAGQCGFGIQCAPGLASLSAQILLARDGFDRELADAFQPVRLKS